MDNCCSNKRGSLAQMRMLREIAILGRLEHPNVVRLVDVSRPPPAPPAGIDTLYVVFEYGGTDLDRLVCACVCVCVCVCVLPRARVRV